MYSISEEEFKAVAARYLSKPAGALFPDFAKNIEEGRCATCGQPITGFRDALSKKEFFISGMCQACQDSVFG